MTGPYITGLVQWMTLSSDTEICAKPRMQFMMKSSKGLLPRRCGWNARVSPSWNARWILYLSFWLNVWLKIIVGNTPAYWTDMPLRLIDRQLFLTCHDTQGALASSAMLPPALRMQRKWRAAAQCQAWAPASMHPQRWLSQLFELLAVISGERHMSKLREDHCHWPQIHDPCAYVELSLMTKSWDLQNVKQKPETPFNLTLMGSIWVVLRGFGILRAFFALSFEGCLQNGLSQGGCRTNTMRSMQKNRSGQRKFQSVRVCRSVNYIILNLPAKRPKVIVSAHCGAVSSPGHIHHVRGQKQVWAFQCKRLGVPWAQNLSHLNSKQCNAAKSDQTSNRQPIQTKEGKSVTIGQWS